LFEIRDATANSLRVGINASGVLKAYYGANIGDGGTTNYAEFKADGELNLHGTARVIKQLYLDAGALK